MKKLQQFFLVWREFSRRTRGCWLTIVLRAQGATVGRGMRAERGVHFRWPPTSGIRFGDNLYLGVGVIIDVQPGARLSIGSRSKIMHYSVIAASEEVEIGSDFQLAEHASLRDGEHALALDVPMSMQSKSSPTRVGDDVWVGRGAAVLMGSTLGSGSVVAANSVVRGQVPERAVVAGAPAGVKRIRS